MSLSLPSYCPPLQLPIREQSTSKNSSRSPAGEISGRPGYGTTVRPAESRRGADQLGPSSAICFPHVRDALGRPPPHLRPAFAPQPRQISHTLGLLVESRNPIAFLPQPSGTRWPPVVTQPGQWAANHFCSLNRGQRGIGLGSFSQMSVPETVEIAGPNRDAGGQAFRVAAAGTVVCYGVGGPD